MSDKVQRERELAEAWRKAEERADKAEAERDNARRQVEALVSAVHVNWCPPRVSHCMMPDGDGSDISKCRKCWSAWAAQQAKEGGK